MSKYAFNGLVVKLTHDDHDLWAAAFRHLDLDAELIARDAWLHEQPASVKAKWYPSTAMYLANRNMKATQPAPAIPIHTKKERAYSTPQFKPERAIKQLPQAERAVQADRVLSMLALSRNAKIR